jgi:hypothetical protein
MDLNLKLYLAEDQSEKELKELPGYKVIVSSLMYTVLAIQPNISFSVAALCLINSQSSTSDLTAAKSFLQILKSTTEFQLHSRSSSGTGSNDQLTSYPHSVWANPSADCKSQAGHVFRLSNGTI